jgi:hypothetical protein
MSGTREAKAAKAAPLIAKAVKTAVRAVRTTAAGGALTADMTESLSRTTADAAGEATRPSGGRPPRRRCGDGSGEIERWDRALHHFESIRLETFR